MLSKLVATLYRKHSGHLLPVLKGTVEGIESRKVTQKAKPAPPPPPPPPKKDKSWVRSKIDSAKEKYEAGKQKIKTKVEHAKEKVKSKFSKSDDTKNTFVQKTTPRINTDFNLKTTKHYGWNPNVHYGGDSILTTKKPLFDRIKEKVKGSEKYVGMAVGWAKKDLGIGVEGPKKPSKILKFGKKAVEFVFKKKAKKTTQVGFSTGGSSGGVGYSGGSYSGGSYSQGYSNPESSDLHQKVEYLRSRLEVMQNKIQGTWNTSEAGTKYKLFEERKNWNDAQLHCEELGSNLAYLDSESKNNYAKILLKKSQNTTMVWFGLRTEIGLESASQPQFSNFAHLDGCGAVDGNGTWTISACTIELPYLCQAFRFDVLVEIP
ncbi:hypothetical protein L3Y34_018852 [Caenorhabditis briggsae]|uniref:C-type lectin domain-containing protein n=1 Tax=Caenorhabditis briggsae TaxID=6238 RepID=A0AAE9IVV8_CAEBR|nr:hypothetical protein L3Y34_018852 [Caenorhabditis briggsae]